MIGWLATESHISESDLADCSVSEEVREECLRRMSKRAAMVLSICTLQRSDLVGLHPMELLALKAAKAGLESTDSQAEQEMTTSSEEQMLLEMVERNKKRIDGQG